MIICIINTYLILFCQWSDTVRKKNKSVNQYEAYKCIFNL